MDDRPIRARRRPRAAKPPPEATIFITPPPTATPEQEATPTPKPTRTPRPAKTPKPTPPPTPKPPKTPKPPTPPPPTPALPAGWPPAAIDSKAAKNHHGEHGIVCGKVVAANWAQNVPGHPTFLNIDKPHPNQRFNVVIWGEQRRAFPLGGKPEITMIGRTVCTSGLIEGFRTFTQIQNVDIGEVEILP
jgi:hypothetical protein